MSLAAEIILAAVITAAILLSLWAVRGISLLPVETGEGVILESRVRATGDGDGLENTVEGLMWLRDNGTLRGNIVISDNGLTCDGRKRAELLAKKYDITIEGPFYGGGIHTN